MSQPTISKCYEEIIVDPLLLYLFPEEEWTYVRELPLMGTLQIRIISERLSACLAFPAIWEEGWVGIYHQQQSKDEWRSHPYGNLSYGWGGRRKPGHGDHLLPLQSSQGRGVWSTLCPTSMQLTGAKCGCSWEVHQLTLHPLRVL